MKPLNQISILLLLSINISIYSNDYIDIDSANQFYAENKFEDAILKYESIIDSGLESSEIYYNLGNAYFKTNNIAKAIVNYERALLLDPKDEDVQYNLELANTYIVDKIESIPPFFLKVWLNNFSLIMQSNNWAIISIASFILFLLLLLIYLFTKKIIIKKISFWFGIVILIISISAFGFSNRNKNILTKNNTAIIMAPSITAKSTPDNSGTDLFVVHEGTKVEVTDQIGEWVEIKLSDGNKGWIVAYQLEKVVQF